MRAPTPMTPVWPEGPIVKPARWAGALLAPVLLAASAAPVAASSNVLDPYPSMDDLVPVGATLETTSGPRWVATGEPPGLEAETGYYQDRAELYLGQSVPGSYDYEYPAGVTVTVRSHTSTDAFEILAGPQFRPDGDGATPVGTIGSDDPLQISLDPDPVRALVIHPAQHSQFSVLVHQQFTNPDLADTYTVYEFAFSYDRWTRVSAPDGLFEIEAENYEATGRAMIIGWMGAAVEQTDQAVLTVQGPDGWTLYTGSGATTTSPVTVPAQNVPPPAGSAILLARQPGDYTVTVSLDSSTATVTMRADDTAFARDDYVVTPPSANCLPMTGYGPGPAEDPQLLVNGQSSNDVIVNAGQEVTFSWASTPFDETVQTYATLQQVWGPSTWSPVGDITDIPVPAGGTADATITFTGAGCNQIRMMGGTGEERYAYVRVLDQQAPSTPLTPTVTIDKKVATVTWEPVDAASTYTVTVDGLDAVTTADLGAIIDLSAIAKGKTKEFTATLVAHNDAGSSSPVEFTISLNSSGKPGTGEHPGKGNGKPH